jgi:hypothetical protein
VALADAMDTSVRANRSPRLPEVHTGMKDCVEGPRCALLSSDRLPVIIERRQLTRSTRWQTTPAAMTTAG